MASDAVNKMANHGYNKSIRRASGQYRALSVQTQTAIIKENGILNTVSIDRYTLSLIREQETDNLHEAKTTMPQENENQEPQNAFKEAKRAEKDHTTVLLEYAVSRIMRYVDTSQRKRYAMRW